MLVARKHFMDNRIFRSGLAIVALTLAFASLPAQAQQTYTLFGATTPANPSESDPNAVTLGLKFYVTQPGTISAIRFYRGHSNSNGYTARLYTGAGAMLGQVKLPSDARHFAAGWETGTFAAPISISENTTYVVAYYTSNGDYGVTDYGLTNGVMNGPLVAPASAGVGGNGVYTYGSSFQFPTSTYEASNYFVDVDFTPSAQAPTLSLSMNPSSPSIPSTTPLGATVATVTASWSDGSMFTGTYGFATPYNNDAGVFALSAASGASVNLIVNPSGPGVSGDPNTTQNISLEATQ
jgi:hypothetical protein